MVTVRVANLKDLNSILELERKSGEAAKEDLCALFKLDNPNEKCYFFVAEHEGKILGYSRLHLYKWNNSAFIIQLLVEPTHRRKGIGTLLLKFMEDFAREKRARVLMFDTSVDNAPALQLYFKNGFRICGYNDKIYENGKVALYLAKEL